MSDLNKAWESLGVRDEISPDFTITKAIVLGHTVTVIDKISKAAILGNINDVIVDFHIEKTGADIKPKIIAIKTLDEQHALGYHAKASSYLAKCNGKPSNTEMISDYELRGTGLKFGDVPLGFDWDTVYRHDEESRKVKQVGEGEMTFGLGVSAPVDKEPVENPYREYNKMIRMYVECKVEALLLDTIQSNLDDKKKYKLTAVQASKLGF